jgi:cytidylate kinase
MIITIDGPVATGKSTIAKRLAEKLNFIFFDTGAMYRCLTYALVSHNIDIDNPAAVSAFLEHFSFDVITKNGEKRYLIGREDVTEKIRSESVTSLVSKVSALTSVRQKLVALQRSLAIDVDAVFEGRDMGTVVFPKAELKIFLWGSPEVRARRRFEELRAKFPKETENLTLEQTILEINRRDTYDSTREISPLKQADDAHLIDTSDLTLDQVVLRILELKATRSQ